MAHFKLTPDETIAYRRAYLAQFAGTGDLLDMAAEWSELADDIATEEPRRAELLQQASELIVQALDLFHRAEGHDVVNTTGQVVPPTKRKVR